MLNLIERNVRSSVIPFYLICILIVSAGVNAVQARSLTSEQLSQMQEVTPEQRVALLEALGATQSRQEAPLPEPSVVNPRRNARPHLISIEDQGVREVQSPTDLTEQEDCRLRLKPFGYDLFAGEPTTFAPATDIPVPVDYVIGPGDTIELQLFGSQNSFHTLVVTREGILNFPELGPITVAGLRFSDLQVTLQQRVSEQLIGVRARITIGRLRSIRVFILGDAYRPGSYTVSALTTMVNALFVSGGVNSIGSLRNIELKRDGQTVATLDLSIGKTVRVDGAVKRPAIYELKNERSTEDVIELAGGLLPTAFPKASQIERISEERERIIVDVDQGTKAGLAVNVEDDDVIRVYSVWFNRGGRVEIQPDDTIVVPLKTDAVRPLAFWKSVAQILYQSAIEVAAVETFGN